jgi:hypothetical protein
LADRWEGITYDPVNKKLYTAISEVFPPLDSPDLFLFERRVRPVCQLAAWFDSCWIGSVN